GAGLLERGLQFVVGDHAVLAFRVNTLVIDALHAVSALLHNAATAHSDVWIAHHFELRRVPILEQQEIKPPHLVRTVIRAVPRPYAAVVDHVVQALGRVRGRADGADQFAGRVLALHARHRLEIRLGILAVALVVGVNAQPVHVTAPIDLLLAHDRYIVFRLAGDDAVVAADAL